ncbi:MAG: substrate-binding domain-containing protein [Planctomycetota bacterium]
MTIGVLTQNIGSPFYDKVTQGVIQGLSDTDYSPIFADGRWDPEIETSAIKTLIDRNVDGLIMVGGNLPGSDLDSLRDSKPMVIVARRLPGWDNKCISVDNVAAAKDATEYLINSGHRKIAHIMGIPEHQDARDRYMGYQAALRDSGIALDEDLVVKGNFSSQSGVLAIESLLMKGVSFTGVFAGNDEMAFGARLAMYRRGIRVPEDVSIVGYDDQPNSAFMTPPLTTVAQPAEPMGEAAAQALLAFMRNQEFVPPRLDTELIVRESVHRIR